MTVAAADEPLLRVEFRGSLMLPAEVAGADGRAERITGISGVTWLGGEQFVAVADNSDLLLYFSLEFSQAGKPLAVKDLHAVRVAAVHDYEDLAPCPTVLASRLAAQARRQPEVQSDPCLLLVEEDTPAIHSVSGRGGELLGTVPLPEVMRHHRPNRGPESLAVDPDDGSLWTANEEALATDGPTARDGGGTTVRIVRLPPPADPPRPIRHYAYHVDPPHEFVRVRPGETYAGVCGLVALGAGRLLVLERTAGPGLPPFVSRVHLVDTTAAADVSAVERDLDGRVEHRLAKQLLWQEAVGCNLEGLCLGPPLVDGNRPLVAVADNGGIDAPTQIVVLALIVPAPRAGPGIIGAAAAIVALALLIGGLSARLTSP